MHIDIIIEWVVVGGALVAISILVLFLIIILIVLAYDFIKDIISDPKKKKQEEQYKPINPK